MNSTEIAIIGGGLTGTVAAIYLKRINTDAAITIYEKSAGNLFRGVPYSHDLEYQPLNVNTKGMTLFDDDPDHFYNWWKTNIHNYPEYKGHEPKTTDFVKRKAFGDYVVATYQQFCETAKNPVRTISGEVVDIIQEDKDHFILLMQDGSQHTATKIFFALGNFPPADPTFLRGTQILKDPGYISHPWKSEAIENLNPDQDILFVGAGLTMVDLTVSLMKRGHRGKMHVISRRGLLPLPHEEVGSYQLKAAEGHYHTALDLFKAIRSEARAAIKAGVNWRSIIDAIRPHTQRLWMELPNSEKKVFLSHIRPYWDIMRHRMPQESFKHLQSLIGSGQMKMHAGRIREVKRINNDQMEIHYLPKGGSEYQSISVSRIINCTGPQSDYRKLNTPLIVNLCSKGWMCPDELFLGIKSAPDGTIIDRDGNSSRPFYTAGPPCKGTLWECTALRDIRSQVKKLTETF